MPSTINVSINHLFELLIAGLRFCQNLICKLSFWIGFSTAKKIVLALNFHLPIPTDFIADQRLLKEAFKNLSTKIALSISVVAWPSFFWKFCVNANLANSFLSTSSPWINLWSKSHSKPLAPNLPFLSYTFHKPPQRTVGYWKDSRQRSIKFLEESKPDIFDRGSKIHMA